MTTLNQHVALLVALAASTGCLAAPEDFATPQVEGKLEAITGTVTSTSFLAVACSESQAVLTAWDATVPTFVSPGEMFVVSATVRLVPPVTAPFAGVFEAHPTLKVSRATPSAPTFSLGATHFGARTGVETIGSAAITLTAPGCAGAPVEVRLDKFDYTITYDNPADRAPLDAHCTVQDPSPSLIAAIPVVDEPQTKAECKNGGYAKHTDSTGATFKNQGACIRYVNHE